jgi:hypothetical protein
VADTPIIKIPVALDEEGSLDAFLAKLQTAKESLSEVGDKWGSARKEATGAGKNSQSGGVFEGAADELSKIGSLVSGPQFTRVFSEFQKIAIGSAASWHAINLDIEKSAKNMSGLGRTALQIGAVGGIGAMAAAAGAGAILSGVPSAAKSLSDENRLNRELGLKPGEATAFNDQYGTTLGANTGDLAKIADIKSDPSKWWQLATATHGGVSNDDIQNKGAVELYLESLQKAGEARKELGGQWSASQGADDLFGSGTVRNASERDPSWWNQQHSQYIEERDKVATDQPKLDQSTAFEQKWQSDLSVLKRDFENAIQPLEPLFLRLANGTTSVIDAFARSPDLEKDINDVATAFDEVAKAGDWLAKKLNAVTGNAGTNTDAVVDVAKEATSLLTDGDRWSALEHGVKHPTVGHTDAKPEPFHWDWHHPFGTIGHKDVPKQEVPSQFDKPAHSATSGTQGGKITPDMFVRDPNRLSNIHALENHYKMPTGYLVAHEQIESHGGTNNINPDGKHLGAFQFDEPTAKRYSVNRFDEHSSEIGAARLLHDLSVKYHGDWKKASAAFDGFAGLDSDIARYGPDWEAHIKEFQTGSETADYLKNMRAQGVDLDPKASVQNSLANLPQVKATGDDSTNSSGRADYGFRQPSSNDSARAPLMLDLNVHLPAGANIFTSTAGIVQ